MNEPAPTHIALILQKTHQPVKEMIAYERSRAVRDGGRDPGFPHRPNHVLDGQGGPVGRGAPLDHGLVHGPIAVVVRDAVIVDIDRHPLEGEPGTPARLAEGYNHNGILAHYGREKRLGRTKAYRGDLLSDDAIPVQPFAVKKPKQLAGWVDGLAAEGIEPREQNLVLHPYASMTGRETTLVPQVDQSSCQVRANCAIVPVPVQSTSSLTSNFG